MKISIGLFGFGRTGTLVADELIKDQECELQWVMKDSMEHTGEFASHLLGHLHAEGRIFSIHEVDFDRFYVENPVDVIIDLSSSCAVKEYQHAVKYGSRIVSAISNYAPGDMERLRALSQQTAILYSSNAASGINFLIEASKLLQGIVPDSNIEIIEEHLKEKISGTASSLAKVIGLDEEQHMNSIRDGVIEKHEVVVGLPNQTIRIIHETHNRVAFEQEVIYAAKWIMSKGAGVYKMEQALSQIKMKHFIGSKERASPVFIN
ncbi:dihydrodipicolinate reductase C-terminal domain-containing protein [Lysinibacillus sp. 54212]|uniref:dihydrodipicolinate reductase C-terminal domain-containing protein n=1 Tax=Lysinibacillus sp. 54212 TaxID=3119829 RepID=UPI002FC80CFB